MSNDGILHRRLELTQTGLNKTVLVLLFTSPYKLRWEGGCFQHIPLFKSHGLFQVSVTNSIQTTSQNHKNAAHFEVDDRNDSATRVGKINN